MLLNIEIIEWVGYLASALIVISLTSSNIIRLRVINSLGCILFVIYGSAIGTWPVVISNSLIIIINMYYLYKIKKEMNN